MPESDESLPAFESLPVLAGAQTFVGTGGIEDDGTAAEVNAGNEVEVAPDKGSGENEGTGDVKGCDEGSGDVKGRAKRGRPRKIWSPKKINEKAAAKKEKKVAIAEHKALLSGKGSKGPVGTERAGKGNQAKGKGVGTAQKGKLDEDGKEKPPAKRACRAQRASGSAKEEPDAEPNAEHKEEGAEPNAEHKELNAEFKELNAELKTRAATQSTRPYCRSTRVATRAAELNAELNASLKELNAELNAELKAAEATAPPRSQPRFRVDGGVVSSEEPGREEPRRDEGCDKEHKELNAELKEKGPGQGAVGDRSAFLAECIDLEDAAEAVQPPHDEDVDPK